MKTITHYFPELSPLQHEQFDALYDLYVYWNERINVISRKDISNLYLHHVLHSLAIAKYIRFKPGTTILDVGTGGGFPGIPLAILFPEVTFSLLDSIGKKIKVATEVATAIEINNIDFIHSRIEEEKRKVHFVVSRAVMPLPRLVQASRKNISDEQFNSLPNGVICLKGGDLTEEIKPFKQIIEVTPLSDYFAESFFETKKLVYVPLK